MRSFFRIAIITLFLAGFSSADQSSSYATTREFYDWYLKAGMKYRDRFSEAEPYFTKELYGMLATGLQNGPDDDFWIDFDPFIAAQWDASKVSVGKPKNIGSNLDMVLVTPFLSRGDQPIDDVKVYCVKQGDKWVIANIAYTGDYPFELKKWLKDGMGN